MQGKTGEKFNLGYISFVSRGKINEYPRVKEATAPLHQEAENQNTEIK